MHRSGSGEEAGIDERGRLMEVKTLQIPEMDAYARYSEVELRRVNEPEPGWFLAESVHVIRRAMEAGFVPLSFLMEPKQAAGEAKELIDRFPEIPLYIAEPEILKQLTGYPMMRGVLSLMQRKRPPSLLSIVKDKRRVAVLEEVTNPTNVGAIFRSAAALNVDALLLTPGCADPLYRRALRVSMGTVFQIPWTYLEGPVYPWQEKMVPFLKEQGFFTAAMALTPNALSIEDEVLEKQEQLALFLGCEGYGLSQETLEQTDVAVKIPMQPGVDSLNVAAASAVAFWELRKK